MLKFVNAQHVTSAKLKFRFDPVFLQVQVLTLDILPSHILESTGASLLVSDAEYDNSAGSVVVGALGLQDGFSGVTGDGPFAVIVFVARTTIDMPTSLTIEEYSVYNHNPSGPPELADNVFVFDGVFQPDE